MGKGVSPTLANGVESLARELDRDWIAIGNRTSHPSVLFLLKRHSETVWTE